MYFEWRQHAFERPPEMGGSATRHPVAIVGGGPVGLALALNLALHGIRSVVVEAKDMVSDGSRAVAMNRRTMQILDRIGVGARVLELAETWDRNTTYYGNDLVYEMALPHPVTERHAPMTNLQQCWMEEIMVQAIEASDCAEIRWLNRVTDTRPHNDHVELSIDTPDGPYTLRADYVVACDGVRSEVRRALGLRYSGTTFEKRYVISDFHMKSEMPMGRRAWFDPPYSRGSTILMHKEPFDIWRLDYQLRDDDDADHATDPEVVKRRIAEHLDMIGESAPWKLVWSSMYRAHALTLDRYAHGRVFFAGDCAHQVPIFGGRGLNHGYADTHNLGWKLAAAIKDGAPASLLESYSDERQAAIADTIEDLTKITMYMNTPNQGVELMRDAVLSLSLSQDFVKQLFDPFRVTPYCHAESPLNGAPHREAEFEGGPPAGLMAPDLPLALGTEGVDTTSLYDSAGTGSTLLYFADEASDGRLPGDLADVVTDAAGRYDLRVLAVGARANGVATPARDLTGRARDLYDAEDGTLYLLRPDDYVAARWKTAVPGELGPALAAMHGDAR